MFHVMNGLMKKSTFGKFSHKVRGKKGADENQPLFFKKISIFFIKLIFFLF